MNHRTFLCLGFPICNVSLVDDPEKSFWAKKNSRLRYSCIQHIFLLTILYVPGTVLGTEDTPKSKTDQVPARMVLPRGGRQTTQLRNIKRECQMVTSSVDRQDQGSRECWVPWRTLGDRRRTHWQGATWAESRRKWGDKLCTTGGGVRSRAMALRWVWGRQRGQSKLSEGRRRGDKVGRQQNWPL